MSEQNVKKFFEAIANSQPIAQKIQQIYSIHRNEPIHDESELVTLIESDIIPIAQSLGMDFTAQEAIKVDNQLFSRDLSSLSEDELNDVSGGFSLKSMAIAMAALAILPTASSLGASAFDAGAHSWTTEVGTDAIVSVREDDADYKSFFNEAMKKKLEASCNKPDEDENDSAYVHHFYNPETGKNYKGGDDSALTRLVNHYNEAVKQYKAGNKDKGIEELARALHFLEDLNVPVHTHNQSVASTLVDATRNHVAFEAKCEKFRKEMTLDKMNLSKESLNATAHYSIEELGKNSARVSNNLYWNIDGAKNFKNNADAVARETVLNAEIAVAKALDMFYRDIQGAKGSAKTTEKQMANIELGRRVEKFSNRYNRDLSFSSTAEKEITLENGQTAYTKQVHVIEKIKEGLSDKTITSFIVDFTYSKSEGDAWVTAEGLGNLSSASFNKDNLKIETQTPVVNKDKKTCLVSTKTYLSNKTSYLCKLLNVNSSWRSFGTTYIGIQCDTNGVVTFDA